MTPGIEEIARVCHEANRAWQIATNDPAISSHWDDFPTEQRSVVIRGVALALQGSTPEELHQKRCESLTANGWTFGPFKDAALKTHPCLVPYEELDPTERLKDQMFTAIVQALSPQA